MNFFSSDPFLHALAAARFSGRRCEPALVSVAGQVFRVLSVDGTPVTGAPFVDFLEPAAADPPTGVRPVAWIPVALRGTVTLAEWKGAGAPPECEPCPYLDWRGTPSWEEAAARLPQQTDTRRKGRKLEAEVGPIRYVADDPDPAAFQRCLQWKSRQYRATGVGDGFADRRNVELFERLRDTGLLTISSLYAGERLAAVHFGVLHEGRFASWIPAYDVELQKYSPGRLLQHAMMEDSFRRGDTEFDFLIGDEEYKYLYATHVRIAGPVGTPPLKVRARKAAKGVARAALQSTGLLDHAKQLKRWLRDRRQSG
ncbi:GNAT family N-acetyltransferase [Longimicrobium sp.]|jgi:hypothetical protein|uniref:GNAT family N-acetyltransferase n=1 Tax=Longimicrobium sp. TaxID=2029185 RepID=UPI002F95212E